jgi:hypothetical protein
MTGGDMSQISPPLRIVLVGSVVFLAAWFVFLRPGGSASTPTTTPVATPAATTVPAKDPSAKANSSLGKDVQKAVAAKQASEASSKASAGETSDSSTSTGGATAPATTTAAKPATTATPAAAAPAKPKTATKFDGLPLSVAKALAEKKVVVLAFWNPKSADDEATRDAVKGLSTHKGKVVVQIADVRKIARYATITRGVDVSQSPSVLVIDRKLKTNLLVGFNTRQTIDQAVLDALAVK